MLSDTSQAPDSEASSLPVIIHVDLEKHGLGELRRHRLESWRNLLTARYPVHLRRRNPSRRSVHPRRGNEFKACSGEGGTQSSQCTLQRGDIPTSAARRYSKMLPLTLEPRLHPLSLPIRTAPPTYAPSMNYIEQQALAL